MTTTVVRRSVIALRTGSVTVTVDSETATVTLNISPVNDAPTGVDDSYNVNEGATLSVLAPGPFDNDTDADGDTLNTTLVTGPQHGSLNLNADGSFTYTHNGNQATSDSFVYQVDDNAGGADTATVTLNILPINDPPSAVGNSYSVDEGQTLNITAPGVVGNDTDPENDNLTATQLTGPQHGTLQLNANGSFSYTHDGGETTSDSFTYRVSDGNGGTDTATVNITVRPVNDPPTAQADSYSVNAGERLDVVTPGVLGNDTDVDNASLTAMLVNGPQYGSLTLKNDGSFSYIHNGGNATGDSFTYKASDGSDESGPVTVNIGINASNIVGDFNNDGAVDESDIALLCHQVNSPVPELRFDLTNDGAVNLSDHDMLISDVMNTFFGDANLDKQFDSTDLVAIFQAGEYEDDIAGNSSWNDGDWNCDGDFTTTDLIVAFQNGGYNQGPKPAAVAASPTSTADTASALHDVASPGRLDRQDSIGRLVRVDDPPAAQVVNLQSRDLIFAKADENFAGTGVDDSVEALVDAIQDDQL